MHPDPLKVLYADDDHNDLSLFGIAVDKVDANIWLLTATSAQQVMEFLSGTGQYADRAIHPLPDLLLLDLHMHQITGMDFLKWFSDSGFRSLPVVVLTASADAKERQQALDLGADLCLLKPLGFQDLKNTVLEIYKFGIRRRAAHS